MQYVVMDNIAIRQVFTIKIKRNPIPYLSGQIKSVSPSRPLFYRRPALKFPTKSTSSTQAPSTTTFSPRASSRSPPRRRYTVPKDALAATDAANQLNSLTNTKQVSTTSKPRYKFAPRRPLKTSTETTSTTAKVTSSFDNDDDTSDQTIESSIQRIRPLSSTGNTIKTNTKDDKDSLESLGDIALSLHSLHTAPLPSSRTSSTSTTEKITRGTVKSTTEKNVSSYDNRVRNRKRTRISTTISPPQITSSTTFTPVGQLSPIASHSNAPLLRRRPQPFEKVVERVTQGPIRVTTGSYTPITIEYDYYDEGDVRIIGQLPANSKVLIHASGVIQCLDQGNFPHPVSCKKFISCAKMENGGVIGWEYTCPNRLSFDPVGGICNWSAGLGCKE